jgi:hypothetical protein
MKGKSNNRRIIVGWFLVILGSSTGLYAITYCMPERFYCHPGLRCNQGIMVNLAGFPEGCYEGTGQYSGMCLGDCMKCMSSVAQQVCVYSGNPNDECSWFPSIVPPPAICGFYGYSPCQDIWPRCKCYPVFEESLDPSCVYQGCYY